MPRICRSTPPASRELRLVALPRRSARRSGRVRAPGPAGRPSVVGELAGDRRPVGLRVAGREADVLVEQERLHLVVRRPACRPGAARPARAYVASGRRAGGQPQHGGGPAAARRRTTSASIVSAASDGHLGGRVERATTSMSVRVRRDPAVPPRSRRPVVGRDHPEAGGEVERGEERRRARPAHAGRRATASSSGSPSVGDTAAEHDGRRVDGEAEGAYGVGHAGREAVAHLDRARVARGGGGEERLGGGPVAGRPSRRERAPGGHGLEAAALAALAHRARAGRSGRGRSRRRRRWRLGAARRRGPARRPGRCRSRGRPGRGSRSARPRRASPTLTSFSTATGSAEPRLELGRAAGPSRRRVRG